MYMHCLQMPDAYVSMMTNGTTMMSTQIATAALLSAFATPIKK